MPWRPIQTATAGLLSLLELKNVGKNPESLIESVQPTVEMSGWWLRGQSVPFNYTEVAAGPIVSFVSLGADEGRWLYIHHCSLAANIVAGATGTEYLIMQCVHPSNGTIVYYDTIANGAATPADNIALNLPRGFWVPPGYVIHLTAGGLAVGDVIKLASLYTPQLQV